MAHRHQERRGGGRGGCLGADRAGRRGARLSRQTLPQRTCVACRQTNAKRQLVRIVRAPDRSVTIDPSGKRSGRGAYLCSTRECWDAGLKRGVLSRALKIEGIPEGDLQTLNDYAQGLEVRPTSPVAEDVEVGRTACDGFARGPRRQHDRNSDNRDDSPRPEVRGQ